MNDVEDHWTDGFSRESLVATIDNLEHDYDEFNNALVWALATLSSLHLVGAGIEGYDKAFVAANKVLYNARAVKIGIINVPRGESGE